MKKKSNRKPKRARIKEPRFIRDITIQDEITIQPTEAIEDLSLAYAVHVWVYVCVRIISTNVAQVPILPYIKKADGSWVEDVKHEMFPVLSAPNPYMSGYNLRQYTAAALVLEGNAYWFIERLGTKNIKELWPLIPGKVRAVATKEKLIDHYLYTVNGREIKINYSEMIHFKSSNPNSFVYGQGSLTAAKNTVATDIFAQVWNKAFFQNSTRPDSVLESDNTLPDGVRKRIKESWKEMHQGPSKHGKTAILDAGLKHKIISENMKDMDFVNLKKEMRIEILASFGVPPSVAGLLEFANYSNMKEQVKTFWSNTLKPLIVNIKDTLTVRGKQITLKMDAVFDADYSDVEALRPDEKARADTAAVYVNMGIPPNQVIQSLDLPFKPFEGGDVSRTQAPVGLPPPAKSKRTSADYITKIELDLIREKAESGDEAETIEAIRTLEWKAFDAELAKQEKNFLGIMREYFEEQRKRVIKALDENIQAIFASKQYESFWSFAANRKDVSDTISLIFNFDAEREVLEKVAEPVISGTYFDFAIKMAKKIKPEFDFNLQDDFALAWINDKKIKLATQASTSTLEAITQEVVTGVEEAVAAGFNESETIAQLKKRIDGVYKFADKHRAERIARTETLSASNAGNQEGMAKTGVKKKEWLSSRDDKVRATHKTMDSQSVAIGQEFVSPSGDTLRFPGDPQAQPGETINCRCTVLPVIED